MASQSDTPRIIEQTRVTEVPGRVNQPNLDRLSSLPNEPGTIPAQGTQAQSRKGRRPKHSGGGTGTTQTGDIKDNRELSIPGTANNPFKDSDNILQTIADRFVKARELQKAEAWRQLQVDLMYASPFICPVIIPYKDLIGIVSEIEKEIKGGTSQVGKSNEEIMAGFLSGSGSLVVAKLDIAPDLERDKSIDIHAIIKPSGGDDGPVKDIPLSTDAPNLPLSPPSD